MALYLLRPCSHASPSYTTSPRPEGHHPSSISRGMLLRLGKSRTCLLSRCMTVSCESGVWQRHTAPTTLQK
ncbi:hypothetical protein FOQG_19423 [Fusarium oxysporum f. sp. raphani 54005]|uniref:Uncharacterized protein n=2 Tax=Fusarium oxysporum TaxID=5507 RepID=X0BAG9_FUSOX|nr:hypothetical protein FOQG_19423 [Fusarium oxysporum f. sp. raphani 54005]EXL38890.1 hypothetical protein FOCG_18480 [Fusarium oxysporum f. sp. radicis-lycopersici 26381]EXL63840.1 hypothetical protein FOPG_19888 [Fusarium oxysporum f. sp. conglutinans race 2 54008]